MKKLRLLLCSLVITSLCLTGCGNIQKVASNAPIVENDRVSSISNSSITAKDISSVVAFMDTLEDVVDDEFNPDYYSTSYDAENDTVYVTTDKANIAFKLDENNNVMFASASGSPDVKAALNQGIAKVCVGIGISNSVDNLFNKVDETIWLNKINSNVIKAASYNTSTNLDLTLNIPDISSWENYFESDLETSLSGGKELPVLTETLKEYEVMDLTDYYESPSLAEFWNEADLSEIKNEINDADKWGGTLRDKFNAYMAEELPDTTLPNWSISSYELPSQFSDGTSTNLAQSTESAFNKYQSELSSYRDKLWAQEADEQNQMNSNYLSKFDTTKNTYSSTLNTKKDDFSNKQDSAQKEYNKNKTNNQSDVNGFLQNAKDKVNDTVAAGAENLANKQEAANKANEDTTKDNSTDKGELSDVDKILIAAGTDKYGYSKTDTDLVNGDISETANKLVGTAQNRENPDKKVEKKENNRDIDTKLNGTEHIGALGSTDRPVEERPSVYQKRTNP